MSTTSRELAILTGRQLQWYNVEIRLTEGEDAGKGRINLNRIVEEVKSSIRERFIALGGDFEGFTFRNDIVVKVEQVVTEIHQANKKSRRAQGAKHE